jgi:hypothetical protein
VLRSREPDRPAVCGACGLRLILKENLGRFAEDVCTRSDLLIAEPLPDLASATQHSARRHPSKSRDNCAASRHDETDRNHSFTRMSERLGLLPFVCGGLAGFP